jgi:hypothetical protein
MQLRTRIKTLLMLMMLVVVVLLLFIYFVAVVRNTDLYGIQKEQNDVYVVKHLDSYSDKGEFSVYIVICMMHVNV